MLFRSPRSAVVTHQGDGDFTLQQPVEDNTISGREFMDRITVEEVVETVAKCGGRSLD